MRKLITVVIALALTSAVAAEVKAEDSSDLEISGNVTLENIHTYRN